MKKIMILLALTLTFPLVLLAAESLEQQFDGSGSGSTQTLLAPGGDGPDLPSHEVVIAGLEQFLREQHRPGDASGA